MRSILFKMTITIEKNNRNSVCAYCKKKISGNKRVKFNYNAYCHLKCRYGVINKWLLEWKPELKLLKKHKKYMLLEGLE